MTGPAEWTGAEADLLADEQDLLATGADGGWAFGTGATDALAGVDPHVPNGIDRVALTQFCLMLGDDALVYSHRLQQWLTWAPELEEETALGNIALDLLGQARLLLARAGQVEGVGRGEDDYAFVRTTAEFRNVCLVERADEDFAELVVRLLVFSCWRWAVMDALRASRDPVLAAIAARAVNELAYHRDYAAGWVVRLGDGTAESRRRTIAALAVLWPLVGELCRPHPVEQALPGVAVEVAALWPILTADLDTVLAAAHLDRPGSEAGAAAGTAGRDGVHTAALDEVLGEMQSIARAHPGARW